MEKGNSLNNANKSAIGFIFSSVPTDDDIKKLESDTGLPVKKIDKKDRVVVLLGRCPFRKRIVVFKG